VAGFYAPLVELFDTAAHQGFIRPEHRGLVLVATEAGAMIDALAAWEAPPPTRKWVD
jgi:predicted Rossmann-fold nucleotide-binding protein